MDTFSLLHNVRVTFSKTSERQFKINGYPILGGINNSMVANYIHLPTSRKVYTNEQISYVYYLN